MQYDTIEVNTIVANRKGEVSSCYIPFCDDLSLFTNIICNLPNKWLKVASITT